MHASWHKVMIKVMAPHGFERTSQVTSGWQDHGVDTQTLSERGGWTGQNEPSRNHPRTTNPVTPSFHRNPGRVAVQGDRKRNFEPSNLMQIIVNRPFSLSSTIAHRGERTVAGGGHSFLGGGEKITGQP